MIAESDDPVTVVELTRAAAAEARSDYPGYLDRFPGLYASAWAELAR